MLTMERTVDSDKIPIYRADECIEAFIKHLNEERALKCKPPISHSFMLNTIPWARKMLKDSISYMEHIQKYITGKEKSTISTYVVFMKHFFDWATKSGWLDTNPVERMRPPTVEKRPRRTLTEADIRKVFSVSMTTYQRIILQLLVEAGCRRHEIAGITLDDLPKDNASRVITIHGKGGKTRVCTVSENTIALIRDSFAKKPRKYLIEQGVGKPMHPVNVHKLFDDVMKAAKIKTSGDGMHMFRRSFITELHRKGVPLATIQKLAGHANMATTFGYIHVNLSDIEKVYELEIFQMLNKIYEGKAKLLD